MHSNPKVQALIELGEAHISTPWPQYPEQYGFDESDITDLIAVVCDEHFDILDPKDPATWTPVHAWRTLGQLRAEAAIDSLINSFDRFSGDDFAITELDKVMALIGPAAISPLSEYLQREGEDQFAYAISMNSLAEIAMAFPSHRSEVLEMFRQYMRKPYPRYYELNGMVMGHLLDLDARELIEDVRHMFSLECVDLSYVGDLEDVETEWGLRD
ncbi:DUF1186 domain-containing protein [Gynuella sp.]|uniref:DUF1186 domain-containing protein n=1 Tax=Gynuella sp. TaxID=2969146 RepID=UPI003D131A8A